MSVKRGLKPLESAHLVSPKALTRLRRYSISSVEELVGALGAQRPAVAKLLGLSEDEAAELEEKAQGALDPEVRAKYEKLGDTPFDPAFGARIEQPEH